MKTLAKRLAFYKSKIGQNGVTDWRQVATASHYWSQSLACAKRYAFGLCGAWNGSKRWVENTESFGFRFVDHCDQIARSIRHTGWFSDNYESETFRGAVWQLPSRKGATVFVYGYQDPNNDGAAFIDFDFVADKEKAAYYADHLAQKKAEESKEFCAKDAAEQDIENAREAIHDNNKEALGLIKEIKQAGNFSPAICAALKNQLRALMVERKKQFGVIAARQDNFWTAVPS